ncbi:hypothetical protein LCGC14_0485750 [marine sediment metagenome]|uniref:Uncharacterized protein n=1 Tax=marine sediment metagenome TaxID=412755 RepID=A0A0F9VGT9_9ZZZZ
MSKDDQIIELLGELLKETRRGRGADPSPSVSDPSAVPKGVLVPLPGPPHEHDWHLLEHGEIGHPTGFYLGRRPEDMHPLNPPEFVGQLYDTAFNDLVPFVGMVVHVYNRMEANLVVWDHFGHQFHVVKARRGDPDNIVREKAESGTAEELPDATVELYGYSDLHRGTKVGWIPGRSIFYAPLQIGVA